MSMLVITRGLPGSGKTTWAKKWLAGDPSGRVRVNRDELRLAMFDIKGILSDQQEMLVTSASKAAVGAALKAGFDVVVDDTNLRVRLVREWAELARESGADFSVETFEVDRAELLRRNETRPRNDRLPAQALERMMRFVDTRGRFGALELSPLPVRAAVEVVPYVPDHECPTALLCDLDGTVASIPEGGRSPYDMTRVGDDAPKTEVIDALVALSGQVERVVFMSGRDDSCRRETLAWLNRHVTGRLECPFELQMRAFGDTRKDAVVKSELFDAHVRHRFAVRWVLDDRDQVVEMWRAMGLTCFQVADGDF